MTRPDALAPDERGVAPRLGLPVALSVAFHALLVVLVFLARPAPAPPSPPVYRVELIAAPPGPRQIGVVNPPTPAAPTPQATPVRPKTAPTDMPAPTATPAPRPTPARATPTVPPQTRQAPSPAPAAGGGETGGRGADVANVSTGGIEFPYPGYLENIVRQIAIRFKPSVRGALRAEVSFLIRRDGTVSPSTIRLVTRSGVYSFDLEAQGAVEAAANANAFGALPSGYSDDVLPVTFRFDPRLLR